MVSYYQNEGFNTFYVLQASMSAMDSYETDMLYNNFVEGIIQPQFRALDGELYVYNKVNGMSSVKEYMSIHPMSLCQIKKLITNICDVVVESRDYMLSPEKLMLSIDSVFCLKDCQEYRFVYMPGDGSDVRKQLKRMIEDIIRNAVHKDEGFVDFVYSLYELVSGINFDIADLRDFADSYKEPVRYNKEDALKSNDVLLDVVFDQDKSASTKIEKTDSYSFDYMKLMHIAIALTFVLTIVIVTYQLVRNSAGLNIRPILCMLVIVCIEIFIYSELRRKNSRKAGLQNLKQKDKLINADVQSQQKKSSREDAESDAFGAAQKNTIAQASYDTGQNVIPVQDDRGAYRAGSCDTGVLASSPYSTTVLSDPHSDRGQSRPVFYVSLISDAGEHRAFVGKDKTKIGRDERNADICINGRGVSRIHATLFEDKQILYIEDSGSTNGTFVNGIRLPGGRRMPIDTGDTVTVGEKEYRVVKDFCH